MAEGDKKFGQVDRTDDIAGGVTFGQEGGGDDRAPTAPADGVEEATGESEGDGFGGFGVDGDGLMTGAIEDVGAHKDEVAADPRFEPFARKVGEEVSAGDAAENAGETKFEKEGAIDVFMKKMTDAANARGKNLGNLHTIADEGGGGAEREEEGGTGDAVGHAEGAVDNLAGEPNEDGDEENGGHDGRLNGGRVCAEEKERDDAEGVSPAQS